MKQSRESPLESEISDFSEIICGADGETPPVIVGGHAVGLWSRYLDEIREILNSHVAEKSSKLWGFDYSSVWPFEQLREFNEDKIARWLEHRFPANGL